MKKPAIIMWVIATASIAGAAQSPANPEADPYPGVDYNQKYRPQFHFTSKKNWINDPNGMVYYDGEYHLFFEHNPSGLGATLGKMSWGHAISKDMVHWKQVQHTILPHDGGGIWSGSGAVDWNNSTGFGKANKDAHKPIVLCYSHARRPFTQAIAYSIDRGRTWTRYKGNPVLPNQGMDAGERDPKIFWHEPTKKWIMVLYGARGHTGFFNSDDLKKWTKVSHLTRGPFTECPDLFELPVDPPSPGSSGATSGDKKKTKWVLYDASFIYSLGTFDGTTFTIEETPGKGDRGGNFYAARTFNDTLDGRVIQMAWMRNSNFPTKGMPFNQQMSFPCELTLRTTDEGIRLYRWPVKEIESLYKKKHKVRKTRLKPGENPLKNIKAELIDLHADIMMGSAKKVVFNADIMMGSAKKVVFNLRGSAVTYDGQTLTIPRGRGALKRWDGGISVRILVDRGSVEVFGNEGRLSLTSYAIHEPENLNLSLTVEGGEAVVNKLVVNELKSAWK